MNILYLDISHSPTHDANHRVPHFRAFYCHPNWTFLCECVASPTFRIRYAERRCRLVMALPPFLAWQLEALILISLSLSLPLSSHDVSATQQFS